MTVKLSAKMSQAIDYIAAYGNAGAIHPRTLDALLTRGMIDDGGYGVRDGVVWNYRVTESGKFVYENDTRTLLGGEFVTVADTRYTDVESAHLAALEFCGANTAPESSAEVFEDADEIAEELAEARTVPFIGHKIVSAQSGWTYRVLGSGDGGIWIERITGADTSSKFVSVCHVTDLSNFTALCEHTDYPSTCAVCAAIADEPTEDATAHQLYDNTLHQSLIVLGSSVLGVFYRYEDDAIDRVRMVLAADLRSGDRYVALCAHHRTPVETCGVCPDPRRTEAIRDAVRLLVSYGIDTPEKFVAAVAALDEEKRQC